MGTPARFYCGAIHSQERAAYTFYMEFQGNRRWSVWQRGIIMIALV